MTRVSAPEAPLRGWALRSAQDVGAVGRPVPVTDCGEPRRPAAFFVLQARVDDGISPEDVTPVVGLEGEQQLRPFSDQLVEAGPRIRYATLHPVRRCVWTRRRDQLLGVSRYRVPSDGTQWAETGSDDGRHSRLISP